jgi:hypothetical protein
MQPSILRIRSLLKNPVCGRMAKQPSPNARSPGAQLLRGHRWPSFCGVELTEGGIEAIEDLIRRLPDLPQRLVGRDPLLDRRVGAQGADAPKA